MRQFITLHPVPMDFNGEPMEIDKEITINVSEIRMVMKSYHYAIVQTRLAAPYDTFLVWETPEDLNLRLNDR